MALFVNTNVSSLNAQRQLFKSGATLDTAFKRLSSGLRINSAADDAAGLQIANRLTGQIGGFNQGIRNANDGISLAQTTEGALDEMTTMYQRIRTLASQAANGSNSDSDRAALQLEMRQLGEEINRIAGDTSFAGNNLLDGTFKGEFQVGANANQVISMSLTSVTNTVGSKVSGATFDFTLSEVAAIASEVAGTAIGVAATSFANVTGLSFTSVDKAQSILAGVDAMIATIDAKRAELGAIQNRFSSTIRNESNIAENLSAARGRIQDADFAAETAKLTMAQILQQASTSILAQANQRPQAALSLLG